MKREPLDASRRAAAYRLHPKAVAQSLWPPLIRRRGAPTEFFA
jgi:hypothetical protein